MIGAVCRSWFSNVEALKEHFGARGGRALTDDERAVMAANVQALTAPLFFSITFCNPND